MAKSPQKPMSEVMRHLPANYRYQHAVPTKAVIKPIDVVQIPHTTVDLRPTISNIGLSVRPETLRVI